MSPPSHTAAVQHIYEQHHSWLQGWLKGKLHDACDAADVAHDTFVRILAGRHAAQIMEPRDYLATIAKGLVIDRWRRQDLERAYLDTIAQLPACEVPSPETRLWITTALIHRLKALIQGPHWHMTTDF